MPTKLVVDNTKLKAMRRHALAAAQMTHLLGTDKLPADLDKLEFPKGPTRAPLMILRRQVLATHKELENAAATPLPATAGNVRQKLRELRRAMKTAVPLTAAEAPLVEKREYGKFVMCVYERKDLASSFRFQPVICDKAGKELHNIHVRSKAAAVSFRYAKRAIDHFTLTGTWPARQGIPVGPATG